MSSVGRITLRVILLLVLVLAVGAFVLDLRARALTSGASDQLAQMSAEQPIEFEAVHGVMQREPTSTREVKGGIIEVYRYWGGVTSQTLRIGYAKDTGQQMVYVDHNLNQPDELELEQVIAAQEYRRLNPPTEKIADQEGPVEVRLTETYRGLQAGGRLILAYNPQANAFTGSFENMTRDVVNQAQVTIRLSNGKEIGPIMIGDVEPGSRITVEGKVEDASGFDRWTAHVERDP